MNDQELVPLSEAEALAMVAQAFAPLKAGGRLDPLQFLKFRVVDAEGESVLASKAISEDVWTDRTQLRDELLALRGMVETHTDHVLDPW